MKIVDVEYDESNDFKITLENGYILWTRNLDSNRLKPEVDAWVAAGNTITPHTPPPPLTVAERVDRAFPNSDSGRALFNTFYELINMVRALEDKVNGTTKGALTKAQLKNWFEGQLNP